MRPSLGLNENVSGKSKITAPTLEGVSAARAYGRALYVSTWAEFDGLYPIRKRSKQMQSAVKQSLQSASEKASFDFLAGYLAASGVQVSGRGDRQLEVVLVQNEKEDCG